ncbi:hypothetical protein NC99_18610 [Sunxiuqinia dokdonensis]|uniref:Uncharacterized protein n=1 Tax=Sunxiuqinia dokdonensis TaxID=1409788 RepID=A0A0L8VAG4_9BACT|nr:hypothetical protein NC99_18610 [Sunxiuqinia dokdonensis]
MSGKLNLLLQLIGVLDLLFSLLMNFFPENSLFRNPGQVYF